MILNNQKGATLILGLLILSAVLSTSILVAGIVFRELKLSFVADESLNTYYASESGSEMALFRHLKQGTYNEGRLKGELPTVGTRWETEAITSAANLNGYLGQHQTKEIPLYDVQNDTSLAGLDSAQVRYNGGGIMEYSIFSWDEDESINFFTKGGEIERGMLKAEKCEEAGEYDCSINFENLDDTKKYIIRFRPTCDPASAELCSGSWDYDFRAYNIGGLLVEIPIGFEVVSSGYKNKEFKKSLEVIVPLRGEAFGIFDYGIFSDDDLSHN